MAFADLAHNRRDALALTSRALNRYLPGTERALQQFETALRAALSSAERELEFRKAELKGALAALAAADEYSMTECQRRVHEAERQVRVAEKVVETIRDSLDQFRGRAQRFTVVANDATLRGQAKLRTLDRDLDRYLVTSSGDFDSAAEAAISGHSSVAFPLGVALAQRGLEEVETASADYSNSPVISWPHASRADVEWAVDRWETVVSKVAARGGSRDELAARDTRDGTTGTMRQLAGIWDVFLGSDAITLSEAPSGRLIVVDGRHRLFVAAEMGVERLPARVIRSRST